jgi:hypothetical protein
MAGTEQTRRDETCKLCDPPASTLFLTRAVMHMWISIVGELLWEPSGLTGRTSAHPIQIKPESRPRESPSLLNLRRDNARESRGPGSDRRLLA